MTKLQWFAECRSEAYLMNSPDNAQVDICVSTIVGILCNSACAKEFGLGLDF